MLSKRILVIIFLFLSIGLTAQTLPNLSFEDWETSQSGRYEDPVGWATGNTPVDIPIIAPSTNPTEMTTDAIDGNYAVKLETIELLFEVASGTVFTGKFELDILNPEKSAKFGIPYSDRPYSLTGFYKYNALQGDSCDMYITLFNSNLNTNTWRGDTVAHAQITSNQAISAYTPFEMVLDYKSSAQVDTIQIVFASSAAGNSLMGTVGARLFVDGLVVNMPTGIKQVLMPEIKVNIFPNPVQNYLNVELEKLVKNGLIEVFSNDGKKVKSVKTNSQSLQIDLSDLSQGTYYYLLLDEHRGAMNSGSFVVGE